ncbi:FAR1-RELATED SEQUENCE 9 protein [Nymphaea thermarum]|nr:FAR1-RELATED SEQUENCE 9 protein [Nymphaea thermarum]
MDSGVRAAVVLPPGVVRGSAIAGNLNGGGDPRLGGAGFRQTKNKGDSQENKKRRVRLVTREGCPAKLVVRKDGSGKWVVRIFVKDHNHPMVLPNKVQYLRSHRSSSTTAQSLIDNCVEAGVDLDAANVRATCTCQMFEYSGLLCRHVLIAFRMKNILRLPSHYILKRITKNAKFGIVVDGSSGRLLVDCEESFTLRFNDICNLGIKFAEDGSASADLYRVSLHALDRAFEDVARMKMAQLSH